MPGWAVGKGHPCLAGQWEGSVMPGWAVGKGQSCLAGQLGVSLASLGYAGISHIWLIVSLLRNILRSPKLFVSFSKDENLL